MAAVTPIRAVLFTCLVLATGCVRFHASPIDASWPASRHIEHRSISGLSVAAQEIRAGSHELEVVGRPARAEGYLPVLLRFENRGPSTFVIRRHDIVLATDAGERYESAPVSEIYRETRFSKGLAAWGLPLGLLPAFVISHNVDEENEDFLEDLRRKAFRDLRLSESPDRCHGLVFFRVEPARARALTSADYTVEVTVVRESSGSAASERIQFTLVPDDSLH